MQYTSQSFNFEDYLKKRVYRYMETKLYFCSHKKVSNFLSTWINQSYSFLANICKVECPLSNSQLANVAWTYLSMPLQQLILLLLRLQLWWFRTKTFSNWYWSLLLRSQTLLCQIIVGCFFLVNCSWCLLDLVTSFLLTFWFFPGHAISCYRILCPTAFSCKSFLCPASLRSSKTC